MIYKALTSIKNQGTCIYMSMLSVHWRIYAADDVGWLVGWLILLWRNGW